MSTLRNLSIGNRTQFLPQEGLQVLRGSNVEDNQQVLMLEVEGFRLLLWPGTHRPMVRSQPTVGAQFVQFNPPGQSLFVKAALSSQFQVYSVIGGSLKFDRAVFDLRNEA